MESPFTYGPANLFLTTVWVSLPSDAEASILLKPLTHADISHIQEFQYFATQSDSFFKIRTYHSTLENAIQDTKNCIDFPSIAVLLRQLPPKDVVFLYERLMEISTVSPEQLSALSAMLDIQFNPVFREDSWNCAICQEKKLDYSRGCGYLPKDERDPSPMLPRIDGKRFTECPIALIDGYISSQTSRAYQLFDAGVLPEPNGFGGQTEWFVQAALLYKRKMAAAERKMYEDAK